MKNFKNGVFMNVLRFKLKQETVKLNINNEMIQARIHSAGIENLHNSTEGGKYKMLFLCL